MAEHALIGYRLVDLPQAIGVTVGVALVYADAGEVQIGISSRTPRGARQQMRRHRLFRALPEIRAADEWPRALPTLVTEGSAGA